MPNFNDHVKLAELAASRFDSRRNYEWKIILAFWLVMLTTLNKDWHSRTMPLWFWAIVVVGFAATWIRGVWIANQNDKRRYEYYWFKAEQAIEQIPPNESPPTKRRLTCCESFGFLLDWNSWFQILATLMIAALVYYNSMPVNSPEVNATIPKPSVMGPAD